MNHYEALRKRATAKNIKTFGDIIKAMDVDPEDIWPGEYDPAMQNETLYWCDAATGALECLAEVGLI